MPRKGDWVVRESYCARTLYICAGVDQLSALPPLPQTAGQAQPPCLEGAYVLHGAFMPLRSQGPSFPLLPSDRQTDKHLLRPPAAPCAVALWSGINFGERKLLQSSDSYYILRTSSTTPPPPPPRSDLASSPRLLRRFLLLLPHIPHLTVPTPIKPILLENLPPYSGDTVDCALAAAAPPPPPPPPAHNGTVLGLLR